MLVGRKYGNKKCSATARLDITVTCSTEIGLGDASVVLGLISVRRNGQAPGVMNGNSANPRAWCHIACTVLLLLCCPLIQISKCYCIKLTAAFDNALSTVAQA